MNAVEATQTRIDARVDALEHSKNSSSSGSRKGNEQNSVRAVATGFSESSTEEVVKEFLQEVITKHAMEESFEDKQCPAQPMTHAFLKVNTENGRNDILRLTIRQQCTNEQRTQKMDHHKTMGFCELPPQHNL